MRALIVGLVLTGASISQTPSMSAITGGQCVFDPVAHLLTCTNVTTSGDLHTAYVFNTSGVFLGGPIQHLTTGGLDFESARTIGDLNASMTLKDPIARAAEAVMYSQTTRNTTTFWTDYGGGVHANHQWGDGGFGAIFWDESQGLASSLACEPAACQVSLNGGVLNESVHASIEIGNNAAILPDGGTRAAKLGGQQFGLAGSQNSDNTSSGGIFRVDMQGNTRPGKMLVTRVSNVNLPRCGIGCLDGGCGTVPKIEFDNSSSTVDDGQGTFNGVIGGMAFNPDSDRLAVCSSTSYGVDAGYEYVVTNYQLMSGHCTLDGASPSKCTGTVRASSNCGCFMTGTTAAKAAQGVAASLSSTTLTCTAANGLTDVVNYICNVP